MEEALTKQRVVTELTRSEHGDLKAYLPIARRAMLEDGDFFAHLIAWNEINGAIDDTKIALPVASLIGANPYLDNALAHLALRDPRQLVRAVRFAKEVKTPGAGHRLVRMVERYLRVREAHPGWFIRTVISHRQSLRTLYAMHRINAAPMARDILFYSKRPPGSALEAIAMLKDMTPVQAATAITKHRLPFLVITSQLGAKAKDPDLVMAMIEQMSPTELVTNTKMLERLGVRLVPALRAAYEAGLAKVAKSTKRTLKTTRAAQQMTDPVLKAKLVATQEKQLAAGKGIEGNWLVLGDKSSSMARSIEGARVIAATLAKMVRGTVHLVFFDTVPRYVNVTGKTYEEILASTRSIAAGGNTSIGSGLVGIMDRKIDVQGIAIVSDGGENTHPRFADAYKGLCQRLNADIPVYFYKVKGDPDSLTPYMRLLGLAMQEFDLTGGVDYYSLPNLVQTMRASRYSLYDEIIETPLLSLDEVFQERKAENVA